MKKHLISELTRLYTGELASILVFYFLYYLKFKVFVLAVFYPLTVLCFILFQGAAYWFICFQRLKGKKIKNVGKVFYILKYFNLVLIGVSVPVILLSDYENIFYMITGLFLFAFSLVEWVNYYVFRLSYRNPKRIIDLIKHNKLKRSQLAKEISER